MSRPTLDETYAALCDLERMGIARRTGYYRGGPHADPRFEVFELTEKGRMLHAAEETQATPKTSH